MEVSVGIRFFDLSYASHQCALHEATDITNEIHRAACRLFDDTDYEKMENQKRR